MKQLFILIISLLTFFNATAQPSNNCRPQTNKNMPQFVIGYGSLMFEQTKVDKGLKPKPNHPVEIKNFSRKWMQPGKGNNESSTTYLGVVPEKNGRLNAIYFQIFNRVELKELDKKEGIHCRVAVPVANIQSLTNDPVLTGQYWIYTTDDVSHHPVKRSPILQSYVDNFLSGCFEMEEKYGIENFARQCIQTTGLWSTRYWVNDRDNPQTPFADPVYFEKIDALLRKMLPDLKK